MEKRVIDLSSWNGLVDFGKVKADGITGVIIRAGATGYGAAHTKFKDEKFETNYKNAKAAGLEVGAYYYSCAMNEAEAKAEAEFFASCIKGKQFELPVYMDVESTDAPSDLRILGKQKLTAIIVKFCETMEKAGYFAGVYSGKYWARDYFDLSVVSRFTFWLAHWTTKTDFTGAFDMWQYSATGRIKGVSGDVDLNYQYKDFAPIIKSLGLNGFAKTEEKPTEINLDGDYFVVSFVTNDKKAAEEYAAKLTEKGFTSAVVLRGDMDNNGKIDANDARTIQRKVVGLD